MKILDAKSHVIDDRASTAAIRKAQGRDPNWNAVNKLRDTPELAKRFRKKHIGENSLTDLANPMGHGTRKKTAFARIKTADEATRTIHADMDSTSGIHYPTARKKYKNLPVRFHAPSDDAVRGGKAVGEINADMDDSKQKVTLHARVADADEWAKVQQGLYTALRVDHDEDGAPTRVSLSDVAQDKAPHHMKLAKSDGTVSTVLLKSSQTNGVGGFAKGAGLDPFRQAMRKPSGSFGR